MTTRTMTWRLACLCGILASSVAAALAADEPLAVFQCVERLGRDWPRTLVTYQLGFEPGKVKPGPMHLLDQNGNQVPCQLSRVTKHDDGSVKSARVSFFAELPKDGSYRYSLVRGDLAAPQRPLFPLPDPNYLTLSNGLTALRMPRHGVVTPGQALRFGTSHEEMVKLYGKQVEGGVIPGPFQGMRLSDGRWVGGSYFWAEDTATAPKMLSYECNVSEQGPLFVEARIRYTFNNDGWYAFTARLLAGDPAIRIDEQCDTKQIGSGWTWRVVMSLSRGWEQGGWKPDAVVWQSSEGRITGHDEALDARLARLGFAADKLKQRSFGSRMIGYTQPYEKVFDLEVWDPWHKAVHYFACVDSQDLAKDRAAIPFLAVVPMHAGNWRGNGGNGRMMLFTHKADDLDLHLPVMADPHPRSMLHTGECDPDLPASFIRRQWALIAGPLQDYDALNAFRSYEGFITLDDYKDWILDWPLAEKVTYPRLVFGVDDVKRLAPVLDQHPGGSVLSKHLYFNDTDARRSELWQQLSAGSEWGGPRGQAIQGLTRGGDSESQPWTAHYRHTQMAGWAGNMDEFLSSKIITLEQRKTLRSHLAALCSVLSEPDFNPRGAMTHLGTPNMPINRFMALAFAAALIPDHPQAKEWLDVSDKYLRYKLAMNVAPGGGWSELITYFGASAPHCMQAAAVLERTGRLSDSTAALAAMPAYFTMQLMSPLDPRFGKRSIPNWGHEGSDLTTHWMVAASLMRNRDPELAKSLVWAWDQLGRPMDQHHDAGFSQRVIMHGDLLNKLEPGYVPPSLRSVALPGFGAIMRAHAGDPNETFVAFRQGYMVSHCDDNQGEFILHAKGAPLVVMSLFAYPIHQHQPYIDLYKEFGWHSNVRCGSRANRMGGWNASSEVHAYGFGEAADYVRGAKDQGDQRWTRQLMLIKGLNAGGADYLVLRDSFSKPEPVWWTLRTFGAKTTVQPTDAGFVYTSPYGPKLDAHFLQPAAMPVESREASRSGPLYFQAAANWRKAGSPVEKDESMINVTATETLTVTSAGPAPAGKDILVALFPKAKGDQAAPAYELLADGAVKITTQEGTDYVFLAGAKPLAFTKDDISFEGVAGAIRVRGDKVSLVVSEGPATVAFKKLSLKSPVPAEQAFGANETKVVEIPAPQHLGLYDVKDDGKRIAGRMAGPADFSIVPAPAWLSRLPELMIDGQTYAPGTSGNQIIVPVMPGEHTFEIRPLEQPPIFRNWQAW